MSYPTFMISFQVRRGLWKLVVVVNSDTLATLKYRPYSNMPANQKMYFIERRIPGCRAVHF